MSLAAWSFICQAGSDWRTSLPIWGGSESPPRALVLPTLCSQGAGRWQEHHWRRFYSIFSWKQEHSFQACWGKPFSCMHRGVSWLWMLLEENTTRGWWYLGLTAEEGNRWCVTSLNWCDLILQFNLVCFLAGSYGCVKMAPWKPN